jgi:hypothetical protein
MAKQYDIENLKAVRRQGFWNQELLKLRESSAHLVDCIEGKMKYPRTDFINLENRHSFSFNAITYF